MSKRGKAGWLVLAASAVAILFGPHARADVIENYEFTGVLSTPINGSTAVTGTFSIDFTTSSVTAFDFSTPVGTIDAASWGFLNFVPETATSPNSPIVLLGSETPMSSNFGLVFVAATSSFASDASTPLYTAVVTLPGGEGQSALSCIPSDTACSVAGSSLFTSGTASLVPASSVPEPGSLSILAAALAGLGFSARRQWGSNR